MASMYDRADIYDLTDTRESRAFYKQYWEKIFEGKNVKTMLDVSIGSGSVTIPVLDLGIELSGSDLSDTMLANCGKKMEKVGISLFLVSVKAVRPRRSFLTLSLRKETVR